MISKTLWMYFVLINTMDYCEGSKISSAFDRDLWERRAQGGYERLGWVTAPEPLRKIIELAGLKGDEMVVDVGTGSQVVSNAIAERLGENGKVIGFDHSPEMLRRGSLNGRLFVADARAVPLPENTTDLVTARMVYHHLPDVDSAIRESYRVLTPGGKLIVSEYVPPDEEALAFERQVFDIKEPERHLWTGEQLAALIITNWNSGGEVLLDNDIMPQYSVRDWMNKSGLSEDIREAVLTFYMDAPPEIVKKMGVTHTVDGDALVDRPFAFVRAIKE
jgi:SAM-dependent methyltransferase